MKTSRYLYKYTFPNIFQNRSQEKVFHIIFESIIKNNLIKIYQNFHPAVLLLKIISLIKIKELLALFY